MRNKILSGLAVALASLISAAHAEEAPKPKTFVYFVAPRPGLLDKSTDAERKSMSAHFVRLQQMLKDGTLILAGPTDPPTIGLVIFQAADLAAAKAWAEADPAVQAGAFTLRSVEAFELALERPSAGVGVTAP